MQRALVVEDLPEVRRGLVRVLDTAFPGLRVDEAGDLRGAHARLREPYQLALIDIGLPDGSGLTLLRKLRAEQPDVLAVVTTIFADDEHIFAALAAGADGYLLKGQEPALLAHQLRQLEHGVPALSPMIARRILGHFRGSYGASEAPLTSREGEVLSLIGRGLSRAEVASALTISEHTVAKYLKDIYRKLNISSRAEAALEARRRGLV
ncbi:MAG: response regulator transcription factor [Polyangiales bacterium]